MNQSLEITVRMGQGELPCPNNCSYCPQTKLKQAYHEERVWLHTLTLSTLHTLLRTVPKNVEIHFSGYTEPTFNKDLGKMMHMCKDQGYHVQLWTTLVGLTAAMAKEIPKSVDHVMIHTPDQRHFVYNDERWIIKHDLWRTLEIPYQAMTMGPVTRALAEHFVQCGWPNGPTPIRMNSRAGNAYKSEALTGGIRCSDDRWHSNVMLPNGKIYLCCMDYGLEHPLGDLLTEDYQAVWDRAEKLKQQLAQRNSITPAACRSCDYGICV